MSSLPEPDRELSTTDEFAALMHWMAGPRQRAVRVSYSRCSGWRVILRDGELTISVREHELPAFLSSSPGLPAVISAALRKAAAGAPRAL